MSQSAPLSARFARARVRAAHRDRPRDEARLIIEWPPGAQEPANYWSSALPKNTSWSKMVNTLMSRWRIERDYEKLKQELGLGHYGGRNWRGFHYHASSCIAAYGFLTLEQGSSRKKRRSIQTPALPQGCSPRGAVAQAAPCTHIDRHLSLPPGPHNRQSTVSVPLLWPSESRAMFFNTAESDMIHKYLSTYDK